MKLMTVPFGSKNIDQFAATNFSMFLQCVEITGLSEVVLLGLFYSEDFLMDH